MNAPTQLSPTCPLNEGTLLRVVSACHARLGRPLHARELDEATQDVRVLIFHHRASVPTGSLLEAWAYGAARRGILKALRARSKGPTAQDEAALREIPSPDTEAADPVTIRVSVRRCIESASPTVARILRGRFDEGRSFETIAQGLNLSREAVRSKYYRALPGLRARLSPLAERVR